MNAMDIWFQCRRLSISLAVNGDRLRYDGPDAAVERMLPVLKAHKEDLLACVTEFTGLPVEDGPFMPWGPLLTHERLKEWQRELFEVVDELSKLEGWHPDDYDFLIGAIERQPISTLRPDLAYFAERLRTERAQRCLPLQPVQQKSRKVASPAHMPREQQGKK